MPTSSPTTLIPLKPKQIHILYPSGKLKTILLGVSNPRPVNRRKPAEPFETVQLQSSVRIEGWYIKAANAKGTVIIFHGYGGEKSSMLEKSDEFLSLGYNTLLMDFMGSGGSEGNATTIGYKEAQDVKAAYDYIASKGEENIFLFGTSLGAAAVLKSLHDYPLHPKAILIECPFGSLYRAAGARLRAVGAGHVNYLVHYREEWRAAIAQFMQQAVQ